MRGGVAPAGGNVSLLLCAAVLFCTAAVGVAYVQFEPVLVPKSGSTKEAIIGSQKVTYGRATRQTFQKVARTTEDHNCILRGCQRMGEVLDIQRNNLTNFDRETLGKASDKTTKVDFSHYPSGGVLMQEEDLGRWFMLYQFEKPNPGTVYRMRIRLENDTALASRLNVPLSFAPFGGLWKPRVAVLTPAGSMMGSEGIPPDGKLYEVAKCLLDAKRFDCLNNWDREGFVDIVEFMRYFGVLPATLLKDGRLELPPAEAIPGFKPYRYGFPYDISLSVNEDDRVENDIAKLYALGRLGAHGIAVMQDGFTVYMAGGKGGLFKFSADGESNDFSRGELSVAILRLKGSGLTTVEKGTEFTIGWIPLGRTSSEAVAGFVTPDSPITFSDMFQHAESEGGVCPNGLELISIGGGEECLKMIDAELAAVFEPERAAALIGGTVGVFQFSEMATRLDSDKFYLGTREILGGEVDVELGKANGADNPTAPITPNECGCVFELKVDASFQATSMVAIMCGTSEEGSDELNKCSTEGVANPRSLTYVNQFEYLLVGEDTELHENNYVWAWDPETRNPTRIFHSSAGGGVTSLSWFQDVVGGNNYIGITISKPIDVFGWLSYFGSFDLTTAEKMSFSSVAVPYARGPKRLPISFSRVTVGEGEYFGGYKELFKTGMKLPRSGNKKQSIKLGQVVDSEFNPVQSYKDGPVEPLVIDQEEMRHRLAFTSMIDMCDNLYSVAVVDSLPGASYVISLKESKKGGKLQAVSADYSDWSRWGGLWQSGGGTISPWNSHIGGEVFEPDSLDFIGFPCLTGFSSCFKSRAEDAFETSIKFIRYFGKYFKSLKNKFENLSAVFNPYNYGYAYEIDVNKFGCSSTTKLMTLGRFSHGDIEIMPDQRTVYMTDATKGRDIGGGLFRFIAKKPGDLSEGTLYAAKLSPVFGTLKRFELEWIKLGSGSNSDLVLRSRKIKFTDMFDFIPSSKRCRLKEVNVKSNVECIDVKNKQDKMAAFFETRRYAALLGATIEFANVKGLTFDRNTQKLFLSISRITKRDRIMLQDDIDGSSNDIKVSASDCGMIYEMPTIESDDTEYDVGEFKESYRGTRDSGVFGLNQCSVEHPANPGSMTSIPGHNQFLIAEDSCNLDRGSNVACGHENNALWAMDPFVARGKRAQARETTRILTIPPLSALESTNWYPQIGGKSYISAGINELYLGGFDGLVDRNEPGARFGYLGPFTSAEADKRRPEIKGVKQVCDDKKPSRGGRFECPKNFKFN